MKFCFCPHYLWVLLATLPFVHSATDISLSGNYIFDLTTDSLPDFQKQISYWTVSGLVGTLMYTFCEHYVLGGIGVLQKRGYYERVYTGLPDHNIIYYSMLFAVYDQWNPSDSFSVYIDGRPIVTNWCPGQSVAGFSVEFCGNPAINDLRSLYPVGSIFHTSSTLTLRVVFDFDTSPLLGGVGFRKVAILLGQKAAGEQEQTTCALKDAPRTVLGVPLCSNPQDTYAAGGSTPACTSACKECFSATQCFSLNPRYTYDGYQTIPCASGCSNCFGPDADQCTYCSSSSLFNYWNYTCLSSCDPPYLTQGSQYVQCLTPCQASGTFMLPDASCSATCDLPLIQRVSGRAKFCDSPCSSSQVLYWTGSCLTLNCEAPGIVTTIGGQNICQYPCDDTSDYYYVKEDLCKSECDYPYKIETQGLVQVCALDIDQDALKQTQAEAKVNAIADLVLKVASMGATLVNPNNVGLLFMASLTDIIDYIKYLNITYPPKLQSKIQEQNDAIDLSFFDIPDAVANYFPQVEVSENIEGNGVVSSFVVNYWQALVALGGVLLAILLSWSIGFCTKGLGCLNSLIVKIKGNLHWNFALGMFCSNYGMVGLYTAVELQNNLRNSIASGVSLLVCMGINGIGLLILCIILCICSHFGMSRSKKVSKDQQETMIGKLQLRWKSYEVLFEEYKHSPFLSQMFFFVFMLRLYVHYFIIGFFYEAPFFQAMALTSISLLIILYLIAFRPLKRMLSNIQQVACEVIIMIVNICITILAGLDKWTPNATETREEIGNIIIGSQISLVVIGSVFMILEFVLMGRDIYLSCTSKSQKPFEEQSEDIEGSSFSNISMNASQTVLHHRRTIERESVENSIEISNSPQRKTKNYSQIKDAQRQKRSEQAQGKKILSDVKIAKRKK